MLIAADTVVTIDYTLRDDEGTVLDSSEGGEPLAYLHGGGQIVPGLEAGLAGHVAGDRLRVVVAPEQGYGAHDPALLLTATRTQFRGVDDIAAGMRFRAEGPEGERIVTVTAIEGDRITLDANHPLAGQTLHFEVIVVGVRAATAEERKHGHGHGAGGHEH